MTRVLVIWPPKLEYVFSIQKHYTNFGETVAYLDSQDGLEVDAMDGAALMYFKWDFMRAYADRYDFLVVYTDLHNAISAISAARQCKAVSPGTQTISYGQGTAYAPELFLQSGFDAAVADPMYQLSILQYIRYCLGQIPAEGVYGVTWRHDGLTVASSGHNTLDVSKVAFPALTKIPVEQYKRISGRDQICFTVSRGCGYSCPFCRVPVDQGAPPSYRPVSDTVSYMRAIAHSCASIKLISATFTENRPWVMEFSRALIESGPVPKWIVTTRLELLDEEMLVALAEAGCIAIAFGLETLYEETQARVGKCVSREAAARQIELIRRSGIIPKAFIMLGIPGQSRSEVDATYAFLRAHGVEIRPKEYYPYGLMLAPGDKMLLLERFERNDLLNSPVETTSVQEFVSWLLDRTAVR